MRLHDSSQILPTGARWQVGGMGMISRRSTFFFVIRLSAGTRLPLLACCGGHEVTGRFYCENCRRAVDRTLELSCSIHPRSVLAESSSLVRNVWAR